MAHIRDRKTKKGWVYDLVDGNFKKKLSARTLTEANEYLKEYHWEKASHKPISLLMKEIRFDNLAKQYLDYAKDRKTSATYTKDRSTVALLCKEFGDLLLESITQIRIEDYQSRMLRKDKAKKTINNHLILLGAMLKYAVDNNYLIQVPKIKKYVVEKRLPTYFSEQEIEKILKNATTFIKNYFLVLFYTGMRLGELIRLKWADIDLKERIIMIRIAKSHRGRILPIPDPLYDLLQKLYIQKKSDQIFLFESSPGKAYVDYYHSFKKYLKSLGIEGYLHKIRSTTATYMINNYGIRAEEVQELLGHQSLQTTQRYTKMRMHSLRSAVNKLPDIANEGITKAQNVQKVEFVA